MVEHTNKYKGEAAASKVENVPITLAAKALCDLTKWLENADKHSNGAVQVRACVNSLQNAVHFCIDRAVALSFFENGFSQVKQRLRLPYKNVSLEFPDQQTLLVMNYNDKSLPEVTADDLIFVRIVQICSRKAGVVGFVGTIDCSDETAKRTTYGFTDIGFDDYDIKITRNYLRAAVGFLALINTTHTEEVIQQASPKNNRRILDGKLPIWEVKTLVLKTPVTRTVSEYQGGTHASPRQHTRRGHYRHYKSGKTAWVRDCIVGSLEKGFVHKDYRVEPAAA